MPQNLSQNIPSTGVPNSSGVTTALPSAGGKSLGTVPNVSVQNPNMQNTYNATPCALGNLMGQGMCAKHVIFIVIYLLWIMCSYIQESLTDVYFIFKVCKTSLTAHLSLILVPYC